MTPAPPGISDAEFVVDASGAGTPLDRSIRERTAASWAKVRKTIESGKVSVNGATLLDPQARLAAGDRVRITLNAPRPAGARRLSGASIVFADRQLVVVAKPAGISTVPYEPGEQGALDQLVRALLTRRSGQREDELGVVQRLDKETSGLLVFARTLAAKRILAQQFRAHSVRRRYLALVHGQPSAQRIESRLVKDRGDGRRGSTSNAKLGQIAVTNLRPIERLGAASLVECRLETGRTHQIRIHLSELGHPVLGDRVYSHGYPGRLLQAPRLMLHAETLGFDHPKNGKPLEFSLPVPDDMQSVINALSSQARRST